MKKKVKSSVKERKKEVLLTLKSLGEKIYTQMKEGRFPWVEMPSRSIDNIYYSPELRQYI